MESRRAQPQNRYDEHLMRLARKLIENRNLLKNLVLRDLRHRYVGSMGGFMWSVVQPVVQLLTYWFAFTVVFQGKPGLDTANVSIPLFLFCGILPWFLFTDTVIRNCSAITDNKSLITKTIIPAEILPIAITISNVVNHAIGLAVLLLVLAFSGTVPLSALGVLLYLPMLVLFAQGLGWIVAGLQVFVRDTIQVLQIVLSVWFWLTPVMYGPGRLKNFEHAAMFSPMAVVVTGYRNSLLGLSQPNVTQVLVAAFISAGVFVAGALIFRQTKPAFADVL
jgi:lipopolysaccharide transport system permease protein